MNKNIVVIGGGHGISAILRGIKNIDNLNITAIVTVADDGGSTGRLRRHYDIPAMGDIRNVLIALADTDSESLIQQLMDYRFEGDGEEDVVGHNLGNLILTALTKSSGSFTESVAILSKILKVRGNIIPSSTQLITLFARMDDDTIVKGEANIPNRDNRIRKVFYQEEVKASQDAVDAIEQADAIIYGIGSIYTSILPNIIINDIREAIARNKCKKIYFCNAMNQPGETEGYSLENHVEAIIQHGAAVDCVIKANDDIPSYILQKYEVKGSQEVIMRKKEHAYQILEYSLLAFDDDVVRHDTDKINECFKDLLKEVI